MRVLITTLGTLLAGATPFAARAAFPNAEATTTAYDLEAERAVAATLAAQDRAEHDEVAELRRAIEQLRAEKAELRAAIDAERARIAADEARPEPEVRARRLQEQQARAERERIERRAAHEAREHAVAQQQRVEAEARLTQARAELERAQVELQKGAEAKLRQARERTEALRAELSALQEDGRRMRFELPVILEGGEGVFPENLDLECETIECEDVVVEVDGELVLPGELKGKLHALDLEGGDAAWIEELVRLHAEDHGTKAHRSKAVDVEDEIEVLLQRLGGGDADGPRRWIEVRSDRDEAFDDACEVIVEGDGERRHVFLRSGAGDGAESWIEVHGPEGGAQLEAREIVIDEGGERRRVLVAPEIVQEPKESRAWNVLHGPEDAESEGGVLRTRVRLAPEPPRAPRSPEAPEPPQDPRSGVFRVEGFDGEFFRRGNDDTWQVVGSDDLPFPRDAAGIGSGGGVHVFETEDGEARRVVRVRGSQAPKDVDVEREVRFFGVGSGSGTAGGAGRAPDRDELLREVHALTSEMLGELRELRSAVDELRRDVRPRGDR